MNESIAGLLTADHEEIDALFAKAVEGDAPALEAFKKRLRLHMRLEEELLFPVLSGTSLAAPARVMTGEHDRLRGLLDDDDLQALPTCLGSHNVKEERVIYPACEGPAFEPVVARLRDALGTRSK